MPRLKTNLSSWKEKAKKEVFSEITKIQPTESNLLAAISYVWLLCLIPLLFIKRKDEYVQFHARQGAVLLVFELIFGWFPLFTIFFVFISIIGFVAALQGKRWKMPVVTTILKQVMEKK